jgi:hypothetical protein
MPRLAGVALPSGGADVVVYTAPALKRATVTLNICNISAYAVNVTVGFVASGSSSIGPADYIEYNTPLDSFGGVIERTGLAPYNGEAIVAHASNSGSVATVWGYTE